MNEPLREVKALLGQRNHPRHAPALTEPSMGTLQHLERSEHLGELTQRRGGGSLALRTAVANMRPRALCSRTCRRDTLLPRWA